MSIYSRILALAKSQYLSRDGSTFYTLDGEDVQADDSDFYKEEWEREFSKQNGSAKAKNVFPSEVVQAFASLGIGESDYLYKDFGTDGWIIVKQSYRSKAKLCHSDKGGADKKMEELNSSYTILKEYFLK